MRGGLSGRGHSDALVPYSHGRVLSSGPQRHRLSTVAALHASLGQFWYCQMGSSCRAVGAQAAVVFPNYSLSPEAKYPTAI
jgi:hypothetical protein